MKNFILIGAAGFVAPRHMKAIKETGNNLIAIVDPSDSVGVVDQYFRDAYYFSSLEELDTFLGQRDELVIDYYSICTPNHYHLEHILFGLKRNGHVICEKPLVLNEREINQVEKAQISSGCTVSTILQLRLHENVKIIQEALGNATMDRSLVKLKYFTPRGNWYHSSWKGDINKSGGLAMNIGVHFFDLLIYLFGDVIKHTLEKRSVSEVKGKLLLQRADVEWHLSIDDKMCLAEIPEGQRTLREFIINGRAYDFSQGFENLHTRSYQRILEGDGYPIDSVRSSITLVESIAKNPKQI